MSTASTASSRPVTAGAHHDLVITTFTESVWLALAGLPALGSLPGSAYPRIARAVRAVAFRRMRSVDGPAGGPRLVAFPRHGGFEGFQVDLAGSIVGRMKGRLGRAHNLDLITRIIPAALSHTLACTSKLDGMRPQARRYRLVVSPIASAI